MIELIAPNIPDIRIDISDIAKSVVFALPYRVPARPAEEHKELLLALAGRIREKSSQGKARSFSFNVTDSLRYRAQKVSDAIFSVRLCLNSCMTLEELGVHQGYAEKLLSPQLKSSGGLVIISGLPGSGKTTTLASVISGRLRTLGGFAVSIEDPIEMPLEGFHGDKGYCEQMSIDEGETFYDKIVDSLRCFPSGDASMLSIGEIRENDAAAELLRIGIDGHLVLSTVHAKGPVEALHRIVTMAAQGGEQSAKTLLANSLRLVIHQKMVNNKPQLSALEVNDKVRATILSGNINALSDEVRATDMKLRGMNVPSIR